MGRLVQNLQKDLMIHATQLFWDFILPLVGLVISRSAVFHAN